MKRKKGVTLLALIITIVVSIILLSSAIGMINNSVSNSRITSFVEEMSLIEQQVRMYYVENKRLPITGESWTVENFIKSVPEKDIDLVKEEIIENGDQNAVELYTLDMQEIGVSRYKTGTKYVVAVPSLKVYRQEGISARGKRYYSLSNKINGSYNTIVNEFSDDLEIDLYISENLEVSRKLSGWTNLLGITINANIQESEELYVDFDGKEVKVETIPNSINVIYFDSLLSTDTNGLKPSLDSLNKFTVADVEKLSTSSSQKKYIDILKKDTEGNLVSKVKIDLNNIDLIKPYLVSDTTVSVKADKSKNIVEFSVKDDDSGVKDIRYEYFKTYDRNDGNIGEYQYYSGTSITPEYLKYAGKIASVDSDGKASVELPSSVSAIKFVVVDNALNTSELYEINTVPEKAVYYSVSSVTNENLDIVFYGQSISSGTVEYSSDGLKYSSKITWNATKNVLISDMKDIRDKIYLRIVSGENTRIALINLPDSLNSGTGVKTKSTYNVPYIPNGFIHTEGTVNEGFVIQDVTNTDTKYNEFVWVPVDGSKIKYQKEEFGLGNIATFQNVLIDNIDAFIETSEKKDEIKQSVEKYGGFYIGRYESGILSVSGDNEGLPCVRKNAIPWTEISQEKAYLNSSLLYKNNADIASTLMTSEAYDTLMNWLLSSKYNVTEFSLYTAMLGNFSGLVNQTGKNEEYVLNNIYDICGNVAELTTETYKTSPIFRGGACSSSGENQVASVRAYNSSGCVLSTVGYRVILYIK